MYIYNEVNAELTWNHKHFYLSFIFNIPVQYKQTDNKYSQTNKKGHGLITSLYYLSVLVNEQFI